MENTTEQNHPYGESPEGRQKITTPVAIIVAGVLIMIGILITNGVGGGEKVVKEKTLSEQVGVSKIQLAECIAGIDKETLSTKIQTGVEGAMKAVPADQRGTPYSVIIGSNGVKTEVRGAESYESVQKAIAEVLAGTVTTKYEGEVPPVDESDHLLGSSSAPVTIIEYSDFECPYCKLFHVTLNKVVTDSGGNVNWVYRHWPIHQNSFEKLVAAECVAKIKGNDAFWKYSELLFGLLNPAPAPVTNQL